MNISEQRQALREGLAERKPQLCDDCGEWPCEYGEWDTCWYQYREADGDLAYLHSQGLVFKRSVAELELFCRCEAVEFTPYEDPDSGKIVHSDRCDTYNAGRAVGHVNATAPIIEKT